MTREQATRKRDKLAAQLSSPTGVLRGSLLQRTVRHSSRCLKCARGEGHPLWVLTVWVFRSMRIDIPLDLNKDSGRMGMGIPLA